MFESVVLRENLNCKIVPGQISVGRFGPGQTEALVAVSQSLDKLVIHEPALRGRKTTGLTEPDGTSLGDPRSLVDSELVYFIGLKDVIKTIAAKRIQLASPPEREVADHDGHQLAGSSTRDLLLIGCSSSVMVLDVLKQSKLVSIQTPAGPVETIARDPLSFHPNALPINSETRPFEGIVCGGQQKIYSMRLETQFDERTIDAELSCERSTGATINCLAQASVSDSPILLAGCLESKILVYQLDTFDHNIQPCRLSIDESAPINCICPIITREDGQESMKSNDDLIGLPSPNEQPPLEAATIDHMNYFAFGCANSYIGVYRLLCNEGGLESEKTLSKERIWRHKCKANPMSLLMYDINGDGLDELIVGYNNSRLEARSPFTGQLLAATRCFKSDRLAGIAVIDYYRDGGLILIACSTNGSMIGYKPRLTRPGVPLRAFTWSGDVVRNSQLDDLTSLSTANIDARPVELNKDFETPQDGSIFAENPIDLHIELSGEHATASRTDAKQSQDLLQNINSLLNEHMSLENKACQIYHLNLNEASKSRPTDTRIAHNWDYDATKAALRLTIVIGASKEKVALIQLEDECRVFLGNGHLLIDPTKAGSGSGDQKSALTAVVVSLRASENKPTRLRLSVFCCPSTQTSGHQEDGSGIHRICCESLDVPRYAMYTLAAETNHELADQTNTQVRKNIIVSFPLKDSNKIQQALNWIYQNFLCLQFGQLIGEESLRYQAGQSNAKLMSTKGKLCPFNVRAVESQGFELKFLDMRKITGPDREDVAREGMKVLDASECKFAKFGSELRIAHSNSRLVMESDNFDLVVDLVRILVIDRLQLEPTPEFASADWKQAGSPFDITPILSKLETLSADAGQLEESEKRIETEMYESAEHTKNLMQQLAIATELNEFNTAKELLNELFMMLNNVQNTAKTHCMNNRSRLGLRKRADELREMAALLTKLSV